MGRDGVFIRLLTLFMLMQLACCGDNTQPSLVISEVSSCRAAEDCWFEVYNPSHLFVDLGLYTVNSSSMNTVSQQPRDAASFDLPDVIIPPDGYIVVSGNTRNLVQRGTQNLRLRSGDDVPYWSENGFIELLRDGVTVDFVSFGSSTRTPSTDGKWNGPSVGSLPLSMVEYGSSIVLPNPIALETTHSSASWSQVAWPTPGGPNDVPVGTPDADDDGIPDSAEVSGGTFAGMDLYAMGARTGQRDILIEVDYMDNPDPFTRPRAEALQKVVDSFAAQGIHVAFDVGTMYSNTVSTDTFNLGQGSNVVPFEQCVSFTPNACALNVSNRRTPYDWKDVHMELRRNPIFHYLLFGNSVLDDGTSGSSGYAEIVGNDFIVTLGGWILPIAEPRRQNFLINTQASVVMHELGHNLGLRHGGFEDLNYKPNYLSVMNYIHNTSGLDADPSFGTAYVRWLITGRSFFDLAEYFDTYCHLVASPCGDPTQFNLDYSNGTSRSLDEKSLLESDNVGRGSRDGAYADWDLNQRPTTSAYARDINYDNQLSVMEDYNDWGHLILPFARKTVDAAGVTKKRILKNMVVPLSDDRQAVAVETATQPLF